MQIDGHHALTYIAARSAGFVHAEAEKIAYAAQYVDDATNAGVIQFADSEYMYARIASAHKMIDLANFDEIRNHLAWLPFHFLPGNGNLPAGQDPNGGELAKLVCRQDSHIARDMLRSAFHDRGSVRELHRLGIAMHVYADTFSHQGFVGALSRANRASRVSCGKAEMDRKIESTTFRELRAKACNDPKGTAVFVWQVALMMLRDRTWPGDFIHDFLKGDPLGHAGADAYPDLPYLKWSYCDWQQTVIARDNPVIYLQATDRMARAMRAWREGDQAMDLDRHPGLSRSDAEAVMRLLQALQEPDGEIRHARWLQEIAAGSFSFGGATLRYAGKGSGSWKHVALGAEKKRDSSRESYPYQPAFLTSDWKCFHDALQAHRSDVVHDILPRYGICAA